MLEKLSSRNDGINYASRFLANTLHEIRTPIQTIIGTIELIQETSLDKEQTEYIRQIQFSAEVLLDLANNILDFSKLRSNEFKLETIPFDIAMVTEQVVNLVSIESFNKGVEIVTDIDESVPSLVMGDTVRVQQIMLNIVKNAVKFTNNGYIHIELSYQSGTICFRVTDSGIGISEEKKKKLFTDYFQADISTYRQFGGTGLGLSICKSLVRTMKGTIGVRANPYGGSIFTVLIPLPAAVEGLEDKNKIKISDIPENTRILIVENNELAKRSLERRLRMLGIKEIESASSSDEAMSQLEFARRIHHPFTIAFINMMIPSIDGWHLASNIKSSRGGEKIKLYLLSPEGQMRGEAKMKLLDWFDGYLYKPVKKDKLVEILETAFGIRCADENEMQRLRDEIINKREQDSSIARGLKILVAEDHSVNRKLMEAFLKNFGAEVYLAEDGEQAVAQIDEVPDIPLIFMDIFMPNKSGVEATEELREKGYNGIIVACTANNDSNDFADYMKIGINDILVKPFKRAAIKATLEKWNTALQIPFMTEIKNIDMLAPVPDDSTKDEIWNHREFLSSVDGDKSFARGLITDFITQTEKLIASIDQNLFNSLNSAAIHQDAHTIKGSAASVYAQSIFEAAKKLDDKSQAADTVQKTALLDTAELRAAFSEFTDFARPIISSWEKEADK
ncbi:response regulator [Treponema saccharophilum]|uniref:response regulator n=1 Tax=Treponema saccharophilum TaxID=165 RepID=UPI003865B4D2